MPDHASYQVSQRPRYRGRFAPSPTGPLHIGSVVAALASFLDARHNAGIWLVRIEDLDPPRELPGASEEILRTLERLGLYWDEAIIYQSQRAEAYLAALDQLHTQGLLYRCRCSRAELSGRDVYPGTCRDIVIATNEPCAIRCKVTPDRIAFRDGLQGIYAQNLTDEVGDFVVRRKDGLFAYQLAVVVDDAWQQITHIIRGMDLLDSTPRQLYLQRRLALPQPSYMHIPIVINAQGQKLGKQQMAAPVDAQAANTVLHRALTLLLQYPPAELAFESVATILKWAVEHWQPTTLTALRELAE